MLRLTRELARFSARLRYRGGDGIQERRFQDDFWEVSAGKRNGNSQQQIERRKKMRKIIGLFAALALVAVVSVPAMAQPLLSTDDLNAAVLTKDSAVAQDKSIAVDVQLQKTDVDVIKDNNTATKGGIVADGKVTQDSNNTLTKNSAKNGGIVATDDAIVKTTKDSYNTKNEAKDGSVVATDDAVVKTTKDSFNTKDSNNTKNDAKNGSIAATGDVTNSGNSFSNKTDIKDTFNKTETEVKIGDINVLVSTADLKGEVENNRLEVEHHSSVNTGDIKNKGNAFSTINGVTVVKQNTGINSQMQTSINVNAALSK